MELINTSRHGLKLPTVTFPCPFIGDAEYGIGTINTFNVSPINIFCP